jgi:hypothetical protein
MAHSAYNYARPTHRRFMVLRSTQCSRFDNDDFPPQSRSLVSSERTARMTAALEAAPTLTMEKPSRAMSCRHVPGGPKAADERYTVRR